MAVTFTPPRIKQKAPATQREPFFYLEDDAGNEVCYTIPTEIPPSVAMRLMDALADGVPEERAVAVMMRDVLGADAMKALANAEGMTQEQLQYLMEVVRTKAMGALQDVGKDSAPSTPVTHSYDA